MNASCLLAILLLLLFTTSNFLSALPVFFSDPVWFHHFVCGLFSSGSAPGSVQQHPGDQGGLLEVHHPVQTTGGVQGPKHWSVAGNPQRSGHSVCCYQRRCWACSSVCLSDNMFTIQCAFCLICANVLVCIYDKCVL